MSGERVKDVKPWSSAELRRRLLEHYAELRALDTERAALQQIIAGHERLIELYAEEERSRAVGSCARATPSSMNVSPWI